MSNGLSQSLRTLPQFDEMCNDSANSFILFVSLSIIMLNSFNMEKRKYAELVESVNKQLETAAAAVESDSRDDGPPFCWTSIYTYKRRQQNHFVAEGLFYDDIEVPNAVAGDAVPFHLRRQILINDLLRRTHSLQAPRSTKIEDAYPLVSPDDDCRSRRDSRALNAIIRSIATCNSSSLADMLKQALMSLDFVLNMYSLKEKPSTDSSVVPIVKFYTELMAIKEKCQGDRELCSLFNRFLLTLAVAAGSQQLLLTSGVELLTALFAGDQPTASLLDHMVSVPSNYVQLERCLTETLFDAHDWVRCGIDPHLKVVEVDFDYSESNGSSPPVVVSFAVDTQYIYVLLQRCSLLKIGSGFGGSVAGLKYVSAKVRADDAWTNVFCHNGNVYLKSGAKILELNREDLEPRSEVVVEPLLLSSRAKIASNGGRCLRLVYLDDDRRQLHVAVLDDGLQIVGDDVYQFPISLRSFPPVDALDCIKTDNGRFTVAGKNVVNVVSVDQRVIALTDGGRILFTDVTSLVQAAEKAADDWKFVSMSARFRKICVNAAATCMVMLSTENDCFLTGSLVEELADVVPVPNTVTEIVDFGRCVSLQTKIHLCCCSDDRICLLTTDGNLFLFGRDNFQLKVPFTASSDRASAAEVEAMFLYCDSCLLLKSADGQVLVLKVPEERPYDKGLETGSLPVAPSEERNGSCCVSSLPQAMALDAVEHVSCGRGHVVAVMTASGMLATWGNNSVGQLGIGSLASVAGVQFPALFDCSAPSSSSSFLAVKAAAAGCNHTAVLASDGCVYTFGDFTHGQLGRVGGGSGDEPLTDDELWYTVPGKMDLDVPKSFLVKRLFAFGDHTVVVLERRPDVPWLKDTMTQTNVACSTNGGCFVFACSEYHVVAKSSDTYFVLDPGTKSVDERNNVLPVEVLSLDASSSSSLNSGPSCFDPYDAFWRFDPNRNRFVCFLPLMTEMDHEGMEGDKTGFTSLAFVDPSTYLPRTEDSLQVPTICVGLNVLRSVCSLLSNAKQLSFRWTRRTGRDSCFDLCYRVVRCEGPLLFASWDNCTEHTKDENDGFEFSSDRDIRLVGFTVFPGQRPCHMEVRILSLTAEERLSTSLASVSFDYSCPDFEDALDVWLDAPVLCRQGAWYRVSLKFVCPCGTICESANALAQGEDGTKFRFRSSVADVTECDRSYLVDCRMVPKLIYVPECVYSGNKAQISTADIGFCPSAESMATMELLLHDLSLPEPWTLSEKAVVTLFSKTAALALEQTTEVSECEHGDGGNRLLRHDHQPAGSVHRTTALLSINILHHLLNQAEADDTDEDAVFSDEKLRRETFALFYRILQSDTTAAAAKDLTDLKAAVVTFLGAHFRLLFTTSHVAHLTPEFLSLPAGGWRMHSYREQLKELTLMMVSFAGSSDTRSLYHLCQSSSSEYDPSLHLEAVFRFISAVTTRLCEGDLAMAGFEAAAGGHVFQVLHHAVVEQCSEQQPTRSMFHTVARFRNSKVSAWPRKGADGVEFEVDRNILLCGFGMYVSKLHTTYDVKLFSVDEEGYGELMLAAFSGEADPEYNLISVMFPEPVRLTTSMKYMLIFILKTGEAFAGEDGVSPVTGSDGCVFTFRQGQQFLFYSAREEGLFPYIYYRQPEEHIDSPSLIYDSAELRSQFWQWVKRFIFLLRSKIEAWPRLWSSPIPVFSKAFLSLCARVMPLIAVFVQSNLSEMRKFVDMFGALLLSLNHLKRPSPPRRGDPTATAAATVESGHPYPAAIVKKFFVTFPKNVDFLVVEFDDRCRTVQLRDTLKITSRCVGNGDQMLSSVGPFAGTTFPNHALILPGNFAEFTLATASRSETTENEAFGFRCYVRGVHVPDCSEENVFDYLEKQVAAALSYVGSTFFWYANDLRWQTKLLSVISETSASCAVPELTDDEPSALFLDNMKSLTQTGLTLRDGVGYDDVIRDTRDFIKSDHDKYSLWPVSSSLIRAPAATAYDRCSQSLEFSRWLIDEPVIDPLNTQLAVLQTGASAETGPDHLLVVLMLRDQYGRKLRSPSHLDVSVLIVATSTDGNSPTSYDLTCLHKASHSHCYSFLQPYQPTVEGRSVFNHVSVRPIANRLSPEELRLLHFGDRARTTVVDLRATEGGDLYTGFWRPTRAGVYHLFCFLGGRELRLLSRRFVQVLFSSRSSSVVLRESGLNYERSESPRMAVCLIGNDRLLQSAAVRSSPSTSSDSSIVIGHVPSGHSFFFTERVTNAEGCWIRMPRESVPVFCDLAFIGIVEGGWCLQASASRMDNDFVVLDPVAFQLVTPGRCYSVQCQERYHVIEDRLFVWSEPSFQATIIGCIFKTSLMNCSGSYQTVRTNNWLFNDDGIWVTIDFADNTVCQVIRAVGAAGSLFGYCCVMNNTFCPLMCPAVLPERVRDPGPTPLGDEDPGQFFCLPSSLALASTVFAAFLRSKGNSMDEEFTACLLYLTFHPHLWLTIDRQAVSSSEYGQLMPFQMFRGVFKQVYSVICGCYNASPTQTAITTTQLEPSDESVKCSGWTTVTAPTDVQSQAGVVCELCGERLSRSSAISDHLVSSHPGCGRSTSFAYLPGGQYESRRDSDSQEDLYCGRVPQEAYGCAYPLCQQCRKKHMDADANRPKDITLTSAASSSVTVPPPSPPAPFTDPAGITPCLRCLSDVLLTAENESRDSHVLNPTASDANSSWSTTGPSQSADVSDCLPDAEMPLLSNVLSRRSAPTASYCVSTHVNSTAMVELSAAVSKFLDLLLTASVHLVGGGQKSRDLLSDMRLSPCRALLYECGYRWFVWLLHATNCRQTVLSQLSFLLTDSRHEPWRRLSIPDDFDTFVSTKSKRALVALHRSLFDTVIAVMQRSDSDQETRRLCARLAFYEPSSISRPEGLLLQEDVLKRALTCLLLDKKQREVEEGEEAKENGDDAERRGRPSKVTIWQPMQSESYDLSKQLKLSISSNKASSRLLLDGQTDTFWISGMDDMASWKQIHAQWHGCAGDTRGFRLHLCFFIDNALSEAPKVKKLAVVVKRRGSRPLPTLKSAFRVLMCQSVARTFVGWIEADVTGLTEAYIKLLGEGPEVWVAQVRLVGAHLPGYHSPSSAVSSVWMGRATSTVYLPRKDVLSFCDALYDRSLLSTTETKTAIEVRRRILDDLLSMLNGQVECQQQRLSSGLSTTDSNRLVVDLIRLIQKFVSTEGESDQYKRSCLEGCCDRRRLLLDLSTLLLMTDDKEVCRGALELLIDHLRVSCRSSDWGLTEPCQQLLKAFAKTLRVRCTAADPEMTFTAARSLQRADGWYVDRRTMVEDPALATRLYAFIRALGNGEYGSVFAQAFQEVISTSTDGPSSLRLLMQETPPRVVFGKADFWLSLASLCFVTAAHPLVETSLGEQCKGHIDDDHDSDREEEKEEAAATTGQPSRSSLSSWRDTAVCCRQEQHGGNEPGLSADIYCFTCTAYFCAKCCAAVHQAATVSDHEFLQRLDIGDNKLVVRNAYVRLMFERLVLVIDKNNCNVVLNILSTDSPLMTPSSRYSASSATEFCNKLLDCGHLCTGVQRESDCLPCLSCANVSLVAQDADDVCMICFWERLKLAPSIQLSCGHVFHYDCCRTMLKKRWPGTRMSFDFMACPLCRQPIQHPLLDDLLQPLMALKADVEGRSLKRLTLEGLSDCAELTDVKSEFYERPLAFAMQKFAYFQCYQCQRPYFGGVADCRPEGTASDAALDPSELICGACSNVAGVVFCPRHGIDYLTYKCRYCCLPAVTFCFGTTHTCSTCHDNIARLRSLQPERLLCPTGPLGQPLPRCPLGVPHPPNGVEFAIGCAFCQMTNDF